jgi:hypothetical protein
MWGQGFGPAADLPVGVDPDPNALLPRMAGETAYPATDNQWFAGSGGVGIQPAKGLFQHPVRLEGVSEP